MNIKSIEESNRQATTTATRTPKSDGRPEPSSSSRWASRRKTRRGPVPTRTRSCTTFQRDSCLTARTCRKRHLHRRRSRPVTPAGRPKASTWSTPKASSETSAASSTTTASAQRSRCRRRRSKAKNIRSKPSRATRRRASRTRSTATSRATCFSGRTERCETSRRVRLR